MKKNVLYRITLLIVILALPLAGTLGQSVTVNLDSARQIIRGFGGINIPAWTGRDMTEDMREKAFGNDPGEMGLSILRLRIDPNPAVWNVEFPTAMHAVDNDVTIFASPWNPPAEMLDPGATENRILPEMYDAYAEHLDSFNVFMSENGIPIYAISVQNEPDYGEWTRWTSEEMVNFVKESAPLISTRVLAPESFQFRRPYTDPLLNDPDALANLDIIGGHIYGGGLFDYPLAREKGKEVWMTEHLLGSDDPSSNDWNLAMIFAKEISDCMEANFNAYVYWYIRRFYGLITDDGNISNKGHVISHYSKFIRPGAVRVDGEVTSANGVSATAFKTDSSLVIVVVNQGTSDVTLDFTIENGAIDSLTQFTSTETRRVANDGGITVTGGLFSATVEARSITTFTSEAGSGGAANNQPPVANAGPDIVVDDADGSGIETILLDGSASTDTDGEITNYSWSFDGMQVAWGEDTTFVDVAIGDHIAVLTVTDNDGASDSDTINISVNSVFNTDLYFEAECSHVGSTWDQLTDPDASNGEYVTTPAGTEIIGEASEDTADHIIIPFEIDEAGPYKVWARVITPSPNDDSWWVRVDDSNWALWNSIPAGNDWHWDDVHDGSDDNPVVYELEAGQHELSICIREDGALLDKVLITNTGVIPDGLGDVDERCPEKPDALTSTANADKGIQLHPNPAGRSCEIIWEQGFTSLKLFSLDGRILISQEYENAVDQTALQLNLQPGLYIIHLNNKGYSATTRLVVE